MNIKELFENFADGKVKGKSKPGRVKKAGASCKGSVTDLRAKAKKYGGERGKMYHWCANMKGGKKKVSESTDDREQAIAEFLKFALKQLDCEKKPKIRLIKDNDVVQHYKSFGGTNIETGEIWVYIGNRNLADILRTFCHELVHFKQFVDGRINGPEDGKTGSDLENEANSQAGIILRHYGKVKPAIFESK